MTLKGSGNLNVNVAEIKAHVTENKPDEKKVIDPMDDDEDNTHVKSDTNILNNFECIRNCTQQ